jgi:nicotinamide mononucleotide adenylyltransferase
MLLRELFENAQSESVGIIFGRFNPPHQGHRAAWKMASENNYWFVGTNQSTEGPKDPLPFKVKVEVMKKIFPPIKGNIVAETSWLTLASKVYKEYGDILLNVYTDEEWVIKTLVQYNGKEGPHGFYKFSNIQPQATPRLSSATDLRNAVVAGDRDAFTKAAGVDANTEIAGQPYFDLVEHYLFPQVEKEREKEAKKKAKVKKEEAAGVGIITKQNTTVDVNKNTPRKNLKAFKLV